MFFGNRQFLNAEAPAATRGVWLVPYSSSAHSRLNGEDSDFSKNAAFHNGIGFWFPIIISPQLKNADDEKSIKATFDAKAMDRMRPLEVNELMYGSGQVKTLME